MTGKKQEYRPIKRRGDIGGWEPGMTGKKQEYRPIKTRGDIGGWELEWLVRNRCTDLLRGEVI